MTILLIEGAERPELIKNSIFTIYPEIDGEECEEFT